MTADWALWDEAAAWAHRGTPTAVRKAIRLVGSTHNYVIALACRLRMEHTPDDTFELYVCWPFPQSLFAGRDRVAEWVDGHWMPAPDALQAVAAIEVTDLSPGTPHLRSGDRWPLWNEACAFARRNARPGYVKALRLINGRHDLTVQLPTSMPVEVGTSPAWKPRSTPLTETIERDAGR